MTKFLSLRISQSHTQKATLKKQQLWRYWFKASEKYYDSSVIERKYLPHIVISFSNKSDVHSRCQKTGKWLPSTPYESTWKEKNASSVSSKAIKQRGKIWKNIFSFHKDILRYIQLSSKTSVSIFLCNYTCNTPTNCPIHIVYFCSFIDHRFSLNRLWDLYVENYIFGSLR